MGGEVPEVEEWRPIPRLPGYEVSDLGRIRSLDRVVLCKNTGPRRVAGRLMKLGANRRGYRSVHLYLEGRRIPREVHTLVALAFIGPRPPGKGIAHWDGNPGNNRLSNLRYATQAENIEDSRRHGTMSRSVSGLGLLNALKTECTRGHPFDQANTMQRPGGRGCRECSRLWQREAHQRNRIRNNQARAERKRRARVARASL